MDRTLFINIFSGLYSILNERQYGKSRYKCELVAGNESVENRETQGNQRRNLSRLQYKLRSLWESRQKYNSNQLTISV